MFKKIQKKTGPKGNNTSFIQKVGQTMHDYKFGMDGSYLAMRIRITIIKIIINFKHDTVCPGSSDPNKILNRTILSN